MNFRTSGNRAGIEHNIQLTELSVQSALNPLLRLK